MLNYSECKYLKLKPNILVTLEEVKEMSLSNLQILGVEKAVEYGIQISQLKKDARQQHLDNLTKLIKTSKAILRQNNLPENKLSKFLNYTNIF